MANSKQERLYEEESTIIRVPADPFLQTHDVTPQGAEESWLFTTSSRYPISIRDQMLRSVLIVERLFRIGLITSGPAQRSEKSKKDRSLLVIGAGAAGVTAAMRAAQLRVKTLLVEKNSELFSLQSRSDRLIDPAQYDWPIEHWGVGSYPALDGVSAQRIPLTWKAATAMELQRSWEQDVRTKLPYLVDLVVHRNAEVVDLQSKPSQPGAAAGAWTNKVYFHLHTHYPEHGLPAEPEPPIQCGNENEKRCHEFEVGVVLLCLGAGPQRVELGNYHGPRFWSGINLNNDLRDIRRRRVTKPVRVLISGGGDGGLQDFIRLVTLDKSAKEVYSAVRKRLDKAGLRFALDKAELAILSAEDQSLRAFQWSALYKSEPSIEQLQQKPHSLHDDHEVNNWIHAVHEQQVQQLKQQRRAWKKIKASLARVTKQDAERWSVDLAFRCSHFGRCYALNHFLALLLFEYFKDTDSPLEVNFRTGLEACGIKAVNHECKPPQSQDPEARSPCYKTDSHEVYFEKRGCKSNVGACRSAQGDEQREYDLILIHHGIWGHEKFLSEAIRPSAPARCLLPYSPFPDSAATYLG